MIYKKFTIKKFKGIDEVDIDLSNNRVITLVGLNESGKTTIMEAISLFYKMIKGDEPSESELKGFRPKGAGFTGNIEITGDLILQEEDRSKLDEYWKNSLGKRTKLKYPEVFSYTYKFYFELDKYVADKTGRTCNFQVDIESSKKHLVNANNNDWRALIKFIKKDIVPEILYYDDFIFEIPQKIQFIKKGSPEGTQLSNDIKHDTNKTWQFVIDDILKSTNLSFESFQERVVDNWDDDSSLAKQHLSEMEGKLNKIITKRWKELFVSTGKKLNFDKIQLNCVPGGNYLNVSFDVITTTHKSFRIDERSKGCKWFFSFLLFTEFRKNRTKNILFLLDEPASNLHSSAQTKIMDALGELSKDSLVIYATHSHHLIKISWLAGAYIIINEILEKALGGDMTFFDRANITAKKYYTYVGEGLGDDKVSYFQPILDALDYKPSSVEPIPDICILEGRNDWYTFKYFQEIILKDKNSYNFYPGAGATKLGDIIRLYLSWGKNFLVIIDGDNEGEEAKKKYIDELGILIEKRIFTLKDVLQISGATEKLIEDSDKQKICNEVFQLPSAKKKNFNLAINQLYANKKVIQISKTTSGRFKDTLAFIRKYFKNNEK
ncbi:AAA family ATPase [Candidatus Daviesbacteria bacterium]|nr:AAA family ATPase [Candidatus Daviesbacteria bacterium]